MSTASERPKAVGEAPKRGAADVYGIDFAVKGALPSSWVWQSLQRASSARMRVVGMAISESCCIRHSGDEVACRATAQQHVLLIGLRIVAASEDNGCMCASAPAAGDEEQAAPERCHGVLRFAELLSCLRERKQKVHQRSASSANQCLVCKFGVNAQ